MKRPAQTQKRPGSMAKETCIYEASADVNRVPVSRTSPKPKTLNPKPQTLNPKPNPKPKAQTPNSKP